VSCVAFINQAAEGAAAAEKARYSLLLKAQCHEMMCAVSCVAFISQAAEDADAAERAR
jgi:hypothetical protein